MISFQPISVKKKVDTKKENQGKGADLVQRHEQGDLGKKHTGNAACKAQKNKAPK